ncbi:MAG: hypothetical protein B6D38_00875 [Anaerolineae bacterium UTCFX1]|nr:MAG: hypothetical protein B6D38_00875 [Anaerolineae bacterium UTCFX1]
MGCGTAIYHLAIAEDCAQDVKILMDPDIAQMLVSQIRAMVKQWWSIRWMGMRSGWHSIYIYMDIEAMLPLQRD